MYDTGYSACYGCSTSVRLGEGQSFLFSLSFSILPKLLRVRQRWKFRFCFRVNWVIFQLCLHCDFLLLLLIYIRQNRSESMEVVSSRLTFPDCMAFTTLLTDVSVMYNDLLASDGGTRRQVFDLGGDASGSKLITRRYLCLSFVLLFLIRRLSNSFNSRTGSTGSCFLVSS